MEVTLRFEVAEPSQVGEARRAAASRARKLGFDEADTERVALVVTELGTNLVKHATGGELLIAVHRAEPGFHVVSIDRGPGSDSPGRWLPDGYSTKGTRGTGLGAVSRLADGLDVHSAPGRGTVAVARVEPRRRADARHAAGAAAPPPAFEIGGVAVPLDGEDECGDAWAAITSDGIARVLLCDGLGHGPDAAAASAEAVRVFREPSRAAGVDGEAAVGAAASGAAASGAAASGAAAARDTARTLDAMSEALRATRGAAASIAEIDPAAGCVRFAGIGNVAGVIMTGESQHGLVSRAGIVGDGHERAREYSYGWSADSLLVLHSDGLRSRWHLGDYPGLLRRNVYLIAAVLYRDFRRGTDDAGVVVARQAARAGAW